MHLSMQLFPDGLAIPIKGYIEKELSDNILQPESLAKIAMTSRAKFSNDTLFIISRLSVRLGKAKKK